MSHAPRRALVVIDVQNEYVSGNLPIEYPDVRLSLANIARAMDAARDSGIPLVVIQNTAPTGSPIFNRHTPGWELHEIVATRPRNHHVEKRLPSAFTGTDLWPWITQMQIDTLVVVGYMTHNCVDSTIKHALHAGMAIEFLSDATGAVSYCNAAGTANAEEIHRAFSVVLHSRFAAVMTTTQWIDAVKTGDAPERDGIFASNQRARGLLRQKAPSP